MIVLHTQPIGLYFESKEESDRKYAACKNDFGGQIEELEIHCDEPPLITEAGYKSIFVHSSNIADIKIAAALDSR